MDKHVKEQLKKKIDAIVEDVIRNINGELPDNDELLEYGRLRPYQTGLKMDIYIDDGCAYIRNNHPLWVYVVNNYDGNAEELIRVPVFGGGKLRISSKLNVGGNDLSDALKWISKYRNDLADYADEKIDREEFYKRIGYRKPVFENLDKGLLTEMSIIRSKDSNLPTDIWVDEGSRPQHGPRIKFRASKEQKTSREFSTMTVSTDPQIMFLPKDSSLSSDEIDKLRQFVILNREALIMLAAGIIDLDTFLGTMQKVD